MKIVADLHVHSKYSRATARDLGIENIHAAAQLKGVDVVGTGDFCHPAWFSEIQALLEPCEPGLFRLNKNAAAGCSADVPPSCRREVRFMLETEISLIYKRDGRTRKNHNLVFVPDLEAAGRLNRKLDAIGNIRSDGRPILGLDARDLLEIVLETSKDAFLIPAHIWTPWFSMLGSKSGFDSIGECFGDLAPHVFAAETGLSSDPEMNWRVSTLDGVTLVSNSDAHSPSNLGREANLFETGLSYFDIRDALRSGRGPRFAGTIEFYPEEGKYHLDGHRSCGTRLMPGETRSHGGTCPVCGRPVTVGVLHRVEELADRPQGSVPEGAAPFYSLIPLADILAEVLQVGAKSRRVAQAYRNALAELGPELELLLHHETDRIDRLAIPLLAEAVKRMREKRVDISAGFDGEYGTIKIFSARERKELLGQRSLFAPGICVNANPASTGRPEASSEQPSRPAARTELNREPEAVLPPGLLNDEQRRAVEYPAAPLLIVAGPGTGKTFTLTRRIAHMITSVGIPPSEVLAVTFTHKAAEEMRVRLRSILGPAAESLWVLTFHGLCWRLLSELPGGAPSVIDEDDQRALIAEAAERAGVEFKLPLLQRRIMQAKQSILGPDELPCREGSDDDGFSAAYRAYQDILESQHLFDYDDLIYRVVRRLETDPAYRESCRRRFRFLCVDEYQDVNHGQYRLIRSLAPPDTGRTNLTVIGDPDQSIYGFRGSDSAYFRQFGRDYPQAAIVRLTRNYRSTETVLKASFQVISRDGAERTRTYSHIEGLRTVGVLELASEQAEARAIARIIEELVGGTGFHSIDTGRVKGGDCEASTGYADIAVLARTQDQLRSVSEAFTEFGVPFQLASRRRVLERKGVAELLSLMRVIDGCAGFADVRRSVKFTGFDLRPAVLEHFKTWCRENMLALKDGLFEVARFPVKRLNRRQQMSLVGFAERVGFLRDRAAAMNVREKIDFVSSQPEFTSRLAGAEAGKTLERLIDTAADFKGSMRAFLAFAALHVDTDHYHPREQKAALMTMHAAKGLEFPVVFIAGCEDGLIPLRRPGAEGNDPAEERRLFYVAMTRARQRLYLTRSRRRRLHGKLEDSAPSPFLQDIEERLLRDETPSRRPTKTKADQLKLF